MLLSTNVLGALLALAAAGVWGGGDFSGGLAARRLNPLQVLVLASFSGCVILLVCLLVGGGAFMSPRGAFWAIGAGASGALGSAALYRALAAGRVASVAPTAAVVGAALPVCFGIVVQGWPSAAQLLGFGAALAGIWLVSPSARSGAGERGREVLALTLLSGLGFGGFFVLLSQTDRGAVYMPLLLVRSTALVISLALVALFPRGAEAPSLWANPASLAAGLLAGVGDALGNIAYLLARQTMRLDVATVLGSLYPAATVLLAAVVLKEIVSARQWAGVALCLLAIVLITP